MQDHQFLAQGIQAGSNANEAIADLVAGKTAKMLDECLTQNFDTILQAKLSAAVTETLSLHTDRTKAIAAQFLSQSKHRMAQSIIDTQHAHRVASFSAPDLADLNAFDTDLNPAVAELADAAGTVSLIDTEATAVGF
jgi:hypothetical protein